MGTTLGNVIVGSLVQGSLYALIAVGFVVLFRSTGVFNFAQGSFMVLGGFLFYTFNGTMGLNVYLALVLTVLAMAVIAASIYLVAFRRLVGAEPFTLVIATLGLSIILQTVTVLIWGPDLRALPVIISITPRWEVLGMAFAPLDVFAIGMSLVLIGGLSLALRTSRLGTRMRAVADNTLLAGFVRIPVNKMSALAWSVAAGCAGAAGVVFSLRTALDSIQLQGFGLLAFAAVLLGGLDSIPGALLGGFVMALLQNLAVRWFGGDWSDVTAYIVLLMVLLLRPQGFFGSRQVVRL